jgi:hypothetical protein
LVKSRIIRSRIQLALLSEVIPPSVPLIFRIEIKVEDLVRKLPERY